MIAHKPGCTREDSNAPTRRGLLLGAAALTAISAGCATTAAPAPTRSSHTRASEVARALYAARPTPALSLAVANSSGVIWSEAFGKADIERDIDTTPAHRFKLGSVSKVLTATAAAKLSARGALDLDAPISTWLPDLPEQHRQTTIKQLLTHRGGIRHYARKDMDPASSIEFREYPTNKEILDIFINDPLVAQPGARVFYSTFGYTLASIAIEAAAKQSFPSLIKAEIADGFRLPSLDTDTPRDLRPMRAAGYNDAASLASVTGRLPPPASDPVVWTNARQTNPAYKWAGGGFIMSPGDLALFGAAHLDSPNARITQQERALLFTPLTEATDNSPPLGLGWRIDADAKGRRRWHHAGSQEGGRASLVVYPDLGLSIAFASSIMTTPGNVLTPSSDLADAFV